MRNQADNNKTTQTQSDSLYGCEEEKNGLFTTTSGNGSAVAETVSQSVAVKANTNQAVEGQSAMEQVPPEYDTYDAMQQAQQGYRIKVVRDFEDMAKVFAIRASACFSDPEHLYSKHFDGSDFSGTHLLGFVDGEPVGTIRIRYFSDFTRIERLCVRPTHRKSRISFKLAKAAFTFCRDKGYRKLSGVAREELVPFWAKLGFKIDDNQAPIHIYGLAHYEMKLIYADAPDAVTADSPPLVLLRPEGRWRAAGYHETINVTKPSADELAALPQRETPRAIASRLSARKVARNRQLSPASPASLHSDTGTGEKQLGPVGKS